MNSLSDEEDELRALLLAFDDAAFRSVEASSSMHAQDLRKHGEQLWEICRNAILFWTPARLEIEALRRASDGVESSIAGIAALIVQKYLMWVHGQHLLEAQWLDQGGSRAIGTARIVYGTSFVRERLHESIEMLERRAVAVEARALDLRLRFDHQKLVSELFGKQLQSTLMDAIRLSQTQATDAEIARIAQQLDRLTSIAPQVEVIAKEVDFIADQAMSAFAERKMQPPALANLRKVAGVVTSQVGKTGLAAVIKKIGG